MRLFSDDSSPSKPIFLLIAMVLQTKYVRHALQLKAKTYQDETRLSRNSPLLRRERNAENCGLRFGSVIRAQS